MRIPLSTELSEQQADNHRYRWKFKPAYIQKGRSDRVSTKPMIRTRHLGITIVAAFAIIAGLGEIVVGFTGNSLGILSKNIAPSLSTAVIGAFYSLGGLCLLTMKKRGAALGILLY